jgi:hypothetical protein
LCCAPSFTPACAAARGCDRRAKRYFFASSLFIADSSIAVYLLSAMTGQLAGNHLWRMVMDPARITGSCEDAREATPLISLHARRDGAPSSAESSRGAPLGPGQVDVQRERERERLRCSDALLIIQRQVCMRLYAIGGPRPKEMSAHHDCAPRDWRERNVHLGILEQSPRFRGIAAFA